MKNSIRLTLLVFVITFTSCRKESVQHDFTSFSQDKLGINAKGKTSLDANCPTPIGSEINRVEIKGNNAVYHLFATVHNTGGHWLLRKFRSPSGSLYQIVAYCL